MALQISLGIIGGGVGLALIAYAIGELVSTLQRRKRFGRWPFGPWI